MPAQREQQWYRLEHSIQRWGNGGRSALPKGLAVAGAVGVDGGRTLVVGTDARKQLQTILLTRGGKVVPGSSSIHATGTREVVDVAARPGNAGALVLVRSMIDGVARNAVVRLRADGGLDEAFGVDGAADVGLGLGDVAAIDVETSGLAVVVLDDPRKLTIRRYESETRSGQLVMSWRATVDLPEHAVSTTLGVDVNLAGEVVATAGARVVRMDSAGALVAAFGTGGIAKLEGQSPGTLSSCSSGRSYGTRAVRFLPEGRVVVSGQLTGTTWCYSGRHPPDTLGGFVAVLRGDGSVQLMRHVHPPEYLDRFDIHDIIFGWGRQLDASLDEIHPLETGGALVVGHSLQSAGPRVPVFVRVTDAGAVDDTFGADGVSIANDVRWGDVPRPVSGDVLAWEGAVRRVTLAGPTDRSVPTLRLPPADIDRRFDEAPPIQVAWNGRRTFRWTMRDDRGGVGVEFGGVSMRRAFVTSSFHGHGFKDRHSGCAALRAVDSVGRRSTWVERCVVVPEPHRALRANAGTRIVRAHRYSGGQAYVLKQPRSSIVARASNGYSTYAIAWTCPTCGWLRVPGLGLTSLRRPGPSRRVLVFVGDVGRSGSRISSAGRAPVIVDGVVSHDELPVYPSG